MVVDELDADGVCASAYSNDFDDRKDGVYGVRVGVDMEVGEEGSEFHRGCQWKWQSCQGRSNDA